MTEAEFSAAIRNVKQPRHHKIKDSIGVSTFANAYYKVNKDIPISTIRTIIKRVNELVSDEVANGHLIKLPLMMGQLELRHVDTYVKFVDGKLKTNRPIDWKATLKLWYSDEQCKEQKILIRQENTKIFQFFYNKGKARYANQIFYQFIPNRTLKQKIKNNIQEGIIKDTFKLI